MTAPLAVLDIQRIGWGKLRAHALHERRAIGDTSHVDLQRRKLNRWTGLDACPERAAKKYIQATGAKIDKRNEQPMTRLLLSASPSYFRPEGEEGEGEYDPARIQAWVKASMGWLRSEFGSDLVHVAYHGDERTPHLHAVVVPTYQKKTKRRTVRQVSHHNHPSFSKQNYATCHDRYAAVVRDLGIERGERLPAGAAKKQHTTKRQWMSNALRLFRKRARRVLEERAKFEAERRRAMPALQAARSIAFDLDDMAQVSQIESHIETLGASKRADRGHSR